jgi:hypothetical protein
MSDAPADLIAIGATIHSSDDDRPSPEAFAVTGERFSYAGPTAGAMALRGEATQILDAHGATILPGIVDAHLHLTNLGLQLRRADLTGASAFEDVVRRAVAFAGASHDEWIVGRGWDQNLWDDATFPSHDALSAAVPDRPVALARVDGHALLVNARAMAVAGVNGETPDPPGGRVLRDASGRATGVFVDAAMRLIYDAIPAPTHRQLVDATRAAIAECNRWGITAVAEPGCDDAVLAAHSELIGRGEYTIRNHAMLDDEPALVQRRMRDGISDGSHGGRLSVRAIKMYADGALGSRGAALLEPYSDDPGNRGLILAAQERIASVTETALRNGWQLCCHAIGDRANRTVLDAFATALRRAGGGDPRLRVEHAQVIAPADLPRFAELGVVASVQASHRLTDMTWAAARLGPERLRGAYAWRALLDAGAAIANGTDAPVESCSTSRTFRASIDPEGHAMTRREALASMTSWAARANFQERYAGSITRGKYADFVVIDRDWMSAGLDAIGATTILATYFAGRRVYSESSGRLRTAASL